MKLTAEEQAMLDGAQGSATQKSTEILWALGKIYQAEQLIPVTSVQISGVSYANLGEAGLHWLAEMAAGGGRARVLTTLNPAGMDIENWQALGISAEFARDQPARPGCFCPYECDHDCLLHALSDWQHTPLW